MIEYRLLFEPNATQEQTDALFGAIEAERKSGKSGYYDLPLTSKELIPKIPSFDEIDTIALIGIGGSSLGSKAVYELLRHHSKHKEILFFENPDPIILAEQFEAIDPKKSLFIVISKSGTTIETISIFKAAMERFGLRPGDKNLIFITDPGSALDRLGAESGTLTYHIPPNVGGRFSVLSAVGIVPLTIAGFDTEAILEGARGLMEAFFGRRAEHILQKALHYHALYPDVRTNVLFSYSSALADFNRWYDQLWGESLGKKRGDERVGLTPIAHIGPVDQHSFLQLLIEGPLDKTTTFLQIERFGTDLAIGDISLPHLEKTDFVNGRLFEELVNGECEATMEAVRRQGIATDLIALDAPSAQNIGELIYYYELLTSATGILLGIDTYDQPGVELGKQILRRMFGAEAS